MISVIVLSYENGEDIFSTLDSVFIQDYPNIQLIISDDCSAFFDQERICTYIKQNKTEQIKSVFLRRNSKNLGTVAHCNITASQCQGLYIKFLASGDGFCDKSALSRLFDFAEQFDVDVITSVSNVCSENFSKIFYEFPSARRVKVIQTTQPEALFSKLAFSNIVSAVGAMFQKSFFLGGGFDEDYRLLEDWPLWLKLCRKGVLIPCLDSPTVCYVIGGVSSQNGNAFNSVALKEDMLLCYEKEILPYTGNLTFTCKNYVIYQYKKLKYWDCYTTAKKIGFTLKYLPFEIYRFLKTQLKTFIIK